MYAVGIDPSCTNTGLVILPPEGNTPILAMKVCPPKQVTTLYARILEVEAGVMGMIAEYVNGYPLIVCIEGYSFNSSFRTVDQVAVGTALRLAIIRKGWRHVEPAPTQVKKFAGVTDKKKKPKAEVAALWGYNAKNADIADAYVMAQIARSVANRKGLTEAQRDVMDALRHGHYVPAAAA